MPSRPSTFEALAQQIGSALEPLHIRLAPENVLAFLAELGLRFPPDLLQPAFVAKLNVGSGAAGALGNTLQQLAASLAAGNSVGVASNVAQLGQEVRSLLAALPAIGTELVNRASSLPGMNAAEVTSFGQQLPASILGHALISHLEEVQPWIVGVANLLGVVTVRSDDGDPRDPAHPAHTVRKLQLSKLGEALTAPAARLRALYQWGDPGFDGTKLIPALGTSLTLLGINAEIPHPEPPDSLRSGFFSLKANTSPPGLSASLHYDLPAGLDITLPLGGSWSIRGQVQGDFKAGLDASIVAPAKVSMKPAAGTLSGSLEVDLVAKGPDPNHPLILLGEAGGSRLQTDSVTLGAGLAVHWNAAAGSATGEPLIQMEVRGGKAVIDTSNADGFIAKILGGFPLECDFDFGATYSIGEGLRFRGSGTLDIQLVQHLTLGPVAVDNLTLSLGIKGDAFPLAVTADLETSLGPLTAVVQGLGFEVAIALRSDNSGNLGPVDIHPGFRSPTGVGLSVDAGGFKGGGFLSIDTAKGEYAGGLELDFLGIVTVKAFGLLNTKFPDGHRGFALVIIISAEFPPIQLGFGFTLVGVGGLLGLSRTVDTDAMRDGIHQGALDSVLFPRDVVANAPRIVNDLRRLFPPFEGHFLVGPMVKFGWGTPTILSLEFGLILEIPRPAFVMIGRLRAGLPFQALPLFDIRLTFAGGVDFAAGQLWFDATLHDSRLLTFALTGDMAVRLYWKENANFILTVGGFHPSYVPPPMGLGSLQRLGITIFEGQPRLRAETYFAITSNTVQFGAKAELMYGIDIFNIFGFIAFDVLIQFDPFRFVAELTAMLGVRTGSHVLMGIRIDALVEGPKPWHAKGTGHFEISLIISIEFDVDFEVSFGDEAHESLPKVDVLPQLAAALAEPNNWRAVTPAGTNVQVTLREWKTEPGTVILHPFGSLEVTEKLVPLNLPVDKLGTQHIGDGRVFGVEQVLLGKAPGQIAPLREQFAPAQFIEMSDAQKLSSHSFERYEAGVQVGGGDAVNATYVKHLLLEYEVVYIPEHRKRITFKLAQAIFNVFRGSGAVGQSPLSAAQTAPSVLGAPRAQVVGEQFAVASTVDLTLHGERMVFLSEAEARAAMRDAIDRDPSLTHMLQVIPSTLVRAA
ncbi:MAG: DUF6603 domain-containing protein [Acidobacteriota bacterium]